LYRKSVISQLNYVLEFDIPKERAGKIAATETLNFNLSANDKTLQLDFKEDKSKLLELIVNGQPVLIRHEKEHLLIPASYLKKGMNEVNIKFQSGEAALN